MPRSEPPSTPASTDTRHRLAAPAGRRSTWAASAAFAAVVLVGGVALGACSSGPPTPSDPTLAKGQEVYAANCTPCHGATGGGGTGPRLIGIGDRMSEEQEIATITDGRSGTAMPAWGTRLSAEEIAAVAAYTRSFTS